MNCRLRTYTSLRTSSPNGSAELTENVRRALHKSLGQDPSDAQLKTAIAAYESTLLLYRQML